MDTRTLAYINLYAILGSLPRLCEMDEKARELIARKNISIGIAVKGGPEATINFGGGKCWLTEGTEGCVIKLSFGSPEKFNGMIDGTVTPIPVKGLTKVGFLLKNFQKLTDILTKYLRPEEKDLEDERFFTVSTTLMLHLIADAIAQVGNEDKVGKASASYIVDGTIKLAIAGGPACGLRAENSRLTALHEAPDKIMSYMEFDSMRTARDLFDGRINAVASVGQGKVRIGGMISQVDNVNRILDRVALYLQ